MPIPSKKRYDIIIAGSGASGCAAAVQAGQEGLSVLLVEKAKDLGGCGVYTEGLLGLQTKEAQAQGIDIAPDEVFKDEAEFSKYRASLPILRDLIFGSGETVEWLRSLGVGFDEVRAMGHGKPVMQPYKGGGWAVINDALLPAARKLGVEILASTALAELHVHESGAIRGATLRDAETGGDVFVAAGAVVVGTGGYINDREMLREYTNLDVDRFVALNHGNAKGDGTRSMWSVGARKHQVGTLMIYGAFLQDPDQPTFAMMNNMTNGAAMQPLLWINEKGERFVNEDVVFNMVLAGNANLGQGRVFSVLSQANVDHLMEAGNFVGMGLALRNGTKLTDLQALIDEALAAGKPFLHKADSVSELAEKLGVSPKALEKTIVDYNRFADDHLDKQFGKPAEYLLKVDQAPYYGFALSTCGFCTMGGVEVDVRNEVINQEGTPIGGLYATGNESSGMIVGDSYDYTNAGLAVSYSFYSGRNAAKHAARYLKSLV